LRADAAAAGPHNSHNPTCAATTDKFVSTGSSGLSCTIGLGLTYSTTGLTGKCHPVGKDRLTLNIVRNVPDALILPDGKTGITVQIVLCGSTGVTRTVQHDRTIRSIPDNRRRVMDNRYVLTIPHKPYRISQLALIPTTQQVVTVIIAGQFAAIDTSHTILLFVKEVKVVKIGFADTIGTISLKATDRTFDKTGK